MIRLAEKKEHIVEQTIVKALILNSGLDYRMGALTADHPKCMTEISADESILGMTTVASCCAQAQLRDDDILSVRGDLDNAVLTDVMASNRSCMTVSSTVSLLE